MSKTHCREQIRYRHETGGFDAVRNGHMPADIDIWYVFFIYKVNFYL